MYIHFHKMSLTLLTRTLTHTYMYMSHAGPYLVITGPTYKQFDPLSQALAPYNYCHVPQLYRLSD